MFAPESRDRQTGCSMWQVASVCRSVAKGDHAWFWHHGWWTTLAISRKMSML